MARKSEPEREDLEDILAREIGESVGRKPMRQHRFSKQRRFAFDMAYPSVKVAVEVDGRSHSSARRMLSDAEKFNLASCMGWRVLRYPATKVRQASTRARIVDQVARMVTGVKDFRSDAFTLTVER